MIEVGNIPQELKELKRWVLTEKDTKEPYAVAGNRKYCASCNNSDDWSTFDNAVKALNQSDRFIGIAFAIQQTDGLIFIDLDDCIDENGNLTDTARQIVDRFDSYTELSTYGKGLRIIIKANINIYHTEKPIEIYSRSHFMTITGNIFENRSVINEREAELQEVIKTYKPTKPQSTPRANSTPIERTPEDTDEMINEFIDRAIEKAKSEGRNYAGLFLASQLRDHDISEFDARGVMKRYQSQVCDMEDHKYTQAEAMASLVSAYKQAKRESWWKPKHNNPGGNHSSIDKSSKEVNPVIENIEKPIKFFKLTDYGNAERLVYWHGDNIRYVWGAHWYYWNGKYWQADNCGHIQRLAKDTVRKIHKEIDLFNHLDDEKFKEKKKEIFSHQGKSESNVKQKAMIELARSEAEIAIETKQLDANPWLLNCNNGTIDLRTGELLPHSKENLITKIVPVDYDPKARLEMWDNFLKTATGGNENISTFLQYSVGYSLTGDTSEEKLFFIHGPTATGKSTFMEAIRSNLGNYARTADFETFLSRSFVGGIRNDIAELAGARFVSSIEVDQGKKLAEGLVKTITGGDQIRARFMYREAFEFIPQFKLWLVANHKPQVNAYDSAMWRRIVVVDFTHVIPEEERDPEVKATLKNTEIAGSAILAWAVKGCLRWQEYGLQIPQEIKEASESYRQEMDVISDFLDEKCVIKADLIVTKQALYFQYKEWCVKLGIIPETKNSLSKILLEYHSIEEDTGSGNVYIWKGIGLKAMTNNNTTDSHQS